MCQMSLHTEFQLLLCSVPEEYTSTSRNTSFMHNKDTISLWMSVSNNLLPEFPSVGLFMNATAFQFETLSKKL